MHVELPKILRMYKTWGTINSLDASHDYHTYGPGIDNCVEICYTDDWDSSCTCVMAIQRGWIWVAAYETHLITGETIAEIIDLWKEELGG